MSKHVLCYLLIVSLIKVGKILYTRPAGVVPRQSRASGSRLDARLESTAACVEQCSFSI